MVLAAAPALAQRAPASEIGNEPSVAVIEVHLKAVEANAPDYARSVAFSMAGTGKYAIMERDEVGQRFRSVLIVPVSRLQQERLDSIERLVRDGDQLVYTNPQAAVSVLNRARQELESIAEGLAANEKLRAEFLKTSMLLARSHMDAGNEAKAADTLREVIRIYGDGIEVTERDYHPRLVKLFAKVKQGMTTEKVASMSVETVQPGCDVMMDGRTLPGATPREFKGLYAGTHHVQVRCGSKDSMIRRVQLRKEQPVHLLVDVGFENALAVEGGKLGLEFESTGEANAYTVPYAAKFGSLVNADLVVIVGFMESGTRAELKARLVDVKKETEIRSTAVPAKTDAVTPSSVRAIVQAFTGAEDIKVVELPKTGPATLPPPVETAPAGRGAWYRNGWAWGMCGLGVAGIVAGGVLTWKFNEAKDGLYYPANWYGLPKATQDAWMQYLNDQADVGNKYLYGSIASYAVGGAAIATGVVLFILTDSGILKTADSATGAPRFALLPSTAPGGGGLLGTVTF
jgi:hypothetical protein